MADFQYLAPDIPDFLKQVTDADALNQDVMYAFKCGKYDLNDFVSVCCPAVYRRIKRFSNHLERFS